MPPYSRFIERLKNESRDRERVAREQHEREEKERREAMGAYGSSILKNVYLERLTWACIL